MKKHELIDAVGKRAGVSQATVREVMDAITEITLATLQNGRAVMLLGLGKLSVVRRGPRRARHMVTGEPIDLPAGQIAKLKPSVALAEAADKAPAP